MPLHGILPWFNLHHSPEGHHPSGQETEAGARLVPITQEGCWSWDLTWVHLTPGSSQPWSHSPLGPR